MEDRFSQQLKKGVLEMLVLTLICEAPNYGYELLNRLKERSSLLFQLKEGTLYPILYRLEDEGLIVASWKTGEGRAAPKKIYEATEAGRLENLRRQQIWKEFENVVNVCLSGGKEND